MKLPINNKQIIVPDKWRYLHLYYINSCDLIDKYGKGYKSIFHKPIIEQVHVSLHSWEAQRTCDEIKNKAITSPDFQIGLLSFLHAITNTSIKIENIEKNYTVIVKSKKKSKMIKTVTLQSATFKILLQNNKDILNFLEYIYLEVGTKAYYNVLRTKKIKRIDKKKNSIDLVSLKIPLDLFADVIEHNRLNLIEIYALSAFYLNIDITIKHQEKRTPYYQIYPFWYGYDKSSKTNIKKDKPQDKPKPIKMSEYLSCLNVGQEIKTIPVEKSIIPSLPPIKSVIPFISPEKKLMII